MPRPTSGHWVDLGEITEFYHDLLIFKCFNKNCKVQLVASFRETG
jgi:hypothetical protein